MRVQNWELLLQDQIDAARERPFEWGQHDCATWAFEVRRVLTSGPDIAAKWRGRYTTALGCKRQLSRLGYASMEEGGRDLLGDPLSAPLMAQRGDLVIGGPDQSFGVCVGATCAFLAEDGLEFLPLSECLFAWRT